MRRRAILVAVWMTMTTAALRCGGDASMLDGGTDATVTGDVGQEAPFSLGDVTTWDHPPIEYPIVDSSGDCAPKTFDGGWASCCDDQPCLGFCVALDGGRVGCSCYGIQGGCERDRDLACCPTERGCNLWLQCTWTK
jgi:hypothetical protein